MNEVGRQKKSWVAMMPVVSYRTLMKEIKKHRALMSEDVEFGFSVTDKQKIGTLATELLFVVRGLRNGAIKSTPIGYKEASK